MRTVISIFFVLLLVSVQTPLGEFLKLPVLIAHFTKHQKQEGVSLFEFLQDHYVGNHSDNDSREDEQLPFKNFDYNAIGLAIVPAVISTDLAISFTCDKKQGFSQTHALHQHLASIFHPPKLSSERLFIS